MTNWINQLQGYLKTLRSEIRSALVCILLTYLVGRICIYFASPYLQISLKECILSPMPAWGTIILVLLLMVNIRLKSQSNSQNTSVKPKIDFIENGDLKWKVRLYPDGKFFIDDTPLCIIHKMKLHHFQQGIYVCYHTGKDGCDAQLKDDGYQFQIEYINALAEQNNDLM